MLGAKQHRQQKGHFYKRVTWHLIVNGERLFTALAKQKGLKKGVGENTKIALGAAIG